MNEAKIRLSPAELELVVNDGLILTKNSILDKVMLLLGELQPVYRQQLSLFSSLPAAVLDSSPKISRGENYRGLPWLVLDYPRCFGQEDVFAIRTMFWWGHFFSLTLHLSGSYKKSAEKKISRSYTALAAAGFFFCISEDPWQHHFEKDNYLAVSEAGKDRFGEAMEGKPFFKLALPFPLQEWDNLPGRLPVQFKNLLGILSN